MIHTYEGNSHDTLKHEEKREMHLAFCTASIAQKDPAACLCEHVGQAHSCHTPWELVKSTQCESCHPVGHRSLFSDFSPWQKKEKGGSEDLAHLVFSLV